MRAKSEVLKDHINPRDPDCRVHSDTAIAQNQKLILEVLLDCRGLLEKLTDDHILKPWAKGGKAGNHNEKTN